MSGWCAPPAPPRPATEPPEKAVWLERALLLADVLQIRKKTTAVCQQCPHCITSSAAASSPAQLLQHPDTLWISTLDQVPTIKCNTVSSVLGPVRGVGGGTLHQGLSPHSPKSRGGGAVLGWRPRPAAVAGGRYAPTRFPQSTVCIHTTHQASGLVYVGTIGDTDK